MNASYTSNDASLDSAKEYSSLENSFSSSPTKLVNEMESDDTPSGPSANTTYSPRTNSGKRKRVKPPDHLPRSNNVSYTDTSFSFGDQLTAADITSVSRRNALVKDASLEKSVTERSFLSIVYYMGSVGGCYYDTEHCILILFHELPESEHFGNTLKMCYQMEPEKILVSSKQNQQFVDVLKHWKSTDEETSVELLPNSCFNLEVSKRRLLSLSSCAALPATASDTDKAVWINSVINFNDKNSVKAAGALMRYIDQNRIGVELEDAHIQSPIVSIQMLSMSTSLTVDSNTMSALQIFENELHPSSFKRGARSGLKEGLSLFGEMNRTKSKIGTIKLKHWFKTPSREIELLTARQNAIRYFALDENLDKTIAFQDCIKQIKSLAQIISKMTTSHASIPDWNTFYKTLYNAVCVSDLTNSIQDDIEIFLRIKGADFDELREILAVMNRIIDFEECKLKNRFVVKHGIDDELDEKKKTYNGLPDLMTKIAEKELSQLDPKILECNVIYLPQLGYLLALPHYPFLQEDDGFAVPGLDFMFLNNDTIHYKSESTKELDSLLGDTQSEICDHETGIMHRLQNLILGHTQTIIEILEFCSEIDCLISIASFARDYRLVFPQLVSDKVISVTNGRHLLQEMCTNQFVANDTHFSFEDGLVKLITGPNACGKSVYLKQVALIVYMAHIGAPVPADEATICICDSIFTRIKSQESVSINLSTFLLDLNQITRAVNGATSKSLIIIDEFGKGTLKFDGIALFAAVVKHWLSKEKESPFILAATHFHSIIALNLLPNSKFLRYETFEILEDDEGVVYLYKLIRGSCTHSQGNYVAKLAGIKDDILNRAEEILETTSLNKPIVARKKDQSSQFKIIKQFLEFDLERGDLNNLCKMITGKNLQLPSNSFSS